jgi:hypothetical protein
LFDFTILLTQSSSSDFYAYFYKVFFLFDFTILLTKSFSSDFYGNF